MKPLTLTTALGLSVMLAACGQEAETNETAAVNTASEAAGSMDEMASNLSGEMGNLAMGADHKVAKGTGTVTKIDKTAGTITLNHGPIPEANWPAMTMAFRAQPQLLDSVKAGDKVTFDLAIKNDVGEVTAIRKQ